MNHNSISQGRTTVHTRLCGPEFCMPLACEGCTPRYTAVALSPSLKCLTRQMLYYRPDCDQGLTSLSVTDITRGPHQRLSGPLYPDQTLYSTICNLMAYYLLDFLEVRNASMNTKWSGCLGSEPTKYSLNSIIDFYL